MNELEREAYIHMFTEPQDASGCSMGNVTFAPGAHNNWHTHYGYQFLLATGGEGYYQEWGSLQCGFIRAMSSVWSRM